MSRTKPITPSPQDTEAAKRAARGFDRVVHRGRGARLQGVDSTSESIEVPPAAVPLIKDILSAMARGQAVAVLPLHATLTTQEAADLLGVSRPFLIGLLNQKGLAFEMVGTHRRIRLRDLLDYQARVTSERRKALDRLAAEAVEAGEYE